MKKPALWLSIALALTLNIVSGCRSQQKGAGISKSKAVPANQSNADSTRSGVRVTPAGVPNTRPNPTPTPPAPLPPR